MNFDSSIINQIMSFFGTLRIKHLIEYLSINMNDLSIYAKEKDLYFNKIEGKILNNLPLNQSIDSEVANFISFLINNDYLDKIYAKKITSDPEWHNNFLNKFDICQILYKSESYNTLIDFFESNREDQAFCRACYGIYRLSLTRVGNYKELFVESFNLKGLISDIRFHWQNGDLNEALKIIALNTESEFPTLDRNLYLNEKIRVLRDYGKLKDAIKTVELIENSLKDIDGESTKRVDYSILMAKTFYNKAINYFYEGEIQKCITLVDESIKNRVDDYSAQYLLLRKAYCNLLSCQIGDYIANINKVKSNPIDTWGESLLINTQALFKRYIEKDYSGAIELVNESRLLEEKTLSKVIYSDILLLYLYIETCDKTKIKKQISRLSTFQHIEAKIATDFANLALKIIASKSIDLEEVNQLIYKSPDYSVYLVPLFSALHSLKVLCTQINALVKNELDFGLFEMSSINENLIDFVNLNLLGVPPKVFISYSWDSDDHKKWVFEFNTHLRKNGIDSHLDVTLSADKTVNFYNMMIEGMTEYNYVIIILTENYKYRADNKKGSVYSEYILMPHDILQGNFDRYIFVLRSGNEESSFPKILRGVSFYNLTDNQPLDEDNDEFIALTKRLKGIPRYNI